MLQWIRTVCAVAWRLLPPPPPGGPGGPGGLPPPGPPVGRETPVCVASSGSHEKIALSLSLCGLDAPFRGRVFSAADVTRGKPHPDLFLHAAQRLGARPEASVVVEDSVVGVAAAAAAGMIALGFAGDSPGEPALARRLGEAGARVFDRMVALPGLLSAL